MNAAWFGSIAPLSIAAAVMMACSADVADESAALSVAGSLAPTGPALPSMPYARSAEHVDG